VRGDACALSCGADNFDLVIFLEVLERLLAPARALRELRRVARAGCLLSVPHEPFLRLANLLRGRNLSRLGDPPDHLQRSRPRDFAAFRERELDIGARTGASPGVLVYGTV